MSEDYWGSTTGLWRLAQGASPMPDSERQFYESARERVEAHRAFVAAHGASSYTPLTAEQEARAVREADDELRRATSRGLAGVTTLADGEDHIITRRMRALAESGVAVANARVTRGPLAPAEAAQWREDITRGVAGAT